MVARGGKQAREGTKFTRTLSLVAGLLIAAGLPGAAAAPAKPVPFEAPEPFVEETTGGSGEASESCENAEEPEIPPVGLKSGTVDSEDERDWYTNAEVASPVGAYMLEVNEADADLYVYNHDCSRLLCASQTSGDAMETCPAVSTLSVPPTVEPVHKVLVFHACCGPVDYTLRYAG